MNCVENMFILDNICCSFLLVHAIELIGVALLLILICRWRALFEWNT